MVKLSNYYQYSYSYNLRTSFQYLSLFLWHHPFPFTTLVHTKVNGSSLSYREFQQFTTNTSVTCGQCMMGGEGHPIVCPLAAIFNVFQPSLHFICSSLVSISIVYLNLFFVVCFCQNGYFLNTVMSAHDPLCYSFDLGSQIVYCVHNSHLILSVRHYNASAF